MVVGLGVGESSWLEEQGSLKWTRQSIISENRNHMWEWGRWSKKQNMSRWVSFGEPRKGLPKQPGLWLWGSGKMCSLHSSDYSRISLHSHPLQKICKSSMLIFVTREKTLIGVAGIDCAWMEPSSRRCGEIGLLTSSGHIESPGICSLLFSRPMLWG